MVVKSDIKELTQVFVLHHYALTCYNRVMKPKLTYIIETSNGETIPILRVHKDKFHIGRLLFNHNFFIMDIMQKSDFKLDLVGKTLKLEDETIPLETLSNKTKNSFNLGKKQFL